MDSKLTTGGAYVTDETITSFQRLLPRLGRKSRAFDTVLRAV